MKPLILYVPGLNKQLEWGKCRLVFRKKSKNILIEEEGTLVIKRNRPDVLWYQFTWTTARSTHMTLSKNQAERVKEYFKFENGG